MTPDDKHSDPLDELRSRIRDTQDAAERLASETRFARERDGAGTGWGAGGAEEHARRTGEVQALVALLESLRELIPHDLREQFRELTRQVLLLVRALIDWWVERMDNPGGADEARGPVVQDIPIA